MVPHPPPPLQGMYLHCLLSLGLSSGLLMTYTTLLVMGLQPW